LDILRASNAQKNHAKALLQLLSDEIPKTKADIKKSLTSKKIYEDYIQILNCIFGEKTNDIAIMLEEIFDNNEPYLISHLAIDGNLLIEKGYKGFEIGKILNELLILVIENPTLNTKENLITNLNQHHRL
jgi:tRNA nucleotidyltransferase (CCA-adding enzyme)